MAVIGLAGYTNDSSYTTMIDELAKVILANTSYHIIEPFLNDESDDHIAYIKNKLACYSSAEIMIVLKVDSSIDTISVYTNNVDDDFITTLASKYDIKPTEYADVFFIRSDKHFRVSCIIESPNIIPKVIADAIKETVKDEYTHGWFKNEKGMWFKHGTIAFDCRIKGISDKNGNISRVKGYFSREIHRINKFTEDGLVYNDYYHDEEGYIQTNKFISFKRKGSNGAEYYYCTDTGSLAKGWILLEDKWHMFDKETGAASCIGVIDNTEYYLDEYGTLDEDSSLYELDKEGNLHKIS